MSKPCLEDSMTPQLQHSVDFPRATLAGRLALFSTPDFGGDACITLSKDDKLKENTAWRKPSAANCLTESGASRPSVMIDTRFKNASR